MTTKNRIKLFMAGMLFPAVFLPIAYTAFYATDSNLMQSHPLQFIPMYIPLLFGIANILFAEFARANKVKKRDLGLLTTGAILGFCVALFGIKVLHIPSLLFGFTGCNVYIPLIFLPIVYALIFRFIVKRVNTLLGV